VKATAKEVGLVGNTKKSKKKDAESPVPDPNTMMGHPGSIYNDTSSDESYDDYDDFKKKASSSRSFRIKKEKRVSKKTMEKKTTNKKDGGKIGGGTGTATTAALLHRAAKKVGTVTKATAKVGLVNLGTVTKATAKVGKKITKQAATTAKTVDTFAGAGKDHTLRPIPTRPITTTTTETSTSTTETSWSEP